MYEQAINVHSLEDDQGLPSGQSRTNELGMTGFFKNSTQTTKPHCLHNGTPFKDSAYNCYCAYILRISRYSDFLSPIIIIIIIIIGQLKEKRCAKDLWPLAMARSFGVMLA